MHLRGAETTEVSGKVFHFRRVLHDIAVFASGCGTSKNWWGTPQFAGVIYLPDDKGEVHDGETILKRCTGDFARSIELVYFTSRSESQMKNEFISAFRRNTHQGHESQDIDQLVTKLVAVEDRFLKAFLEYVFQASKSYFFNNFPVFIRSQKGIDFVSITVLKLALRFFSKPLET
jgi:hypothetical protein